MDDVSTITAPVFSSSFAPEPAGDDEGATIIATMRGAVVLSDATVTKRQTGISSSQQQQQDVVASQSRWEVGQVVDGMYDIVKLLGQGGMGTVHAVYHRTWRKTLAVKTPRADRFATQEDKDAFLHECEAWVNIGTHPNIVCAFLVREIAGMPRVFAEVVSDGDLTKWISKRWMYEGTEREVKARMLDCAIQVAWGLGFANSKGLVHQDMKPDNVMVSNKRRLLFKVTDFGLSIVRHDQPNDLVDKKKKANDRKNVADSKHAHPLTELAAPPYPQGTYGCDGCGVSSTETVYHCNTCGTYDNCPKCFVANKNTIAASPHVHGQPHAHSFLILHNITMESGGGCDGCGNAITTSPAYHCFECGNFDYCPSCFEAGNNKLERRRKPRHVHALTQQAQVTYEGGIYYCNGCQKGYDRGQFNCAACKYDNCPNCFPTQQVAFGAAHPHLMVFLVKSDCGICVRCELPQAGCEAYHCPSCQEVLCKKCFKLPPPANSLNELNTMARQYGIPTDDNEESDGENEQEDDEEEEEESNEKEEEEIKEPYRDEEQLEHYPFVSEDEYEKKIIQRQAKLPTRSMAPFAGGTPQYWAPEQASSYKKLQAAETEEEYKTLVENLPMLSQKADIYAYGNTMLQLLIGKRTWKRGEGGACVQMQHYEKEREPDVPEIPELNNLIARCLCLKQRNRPKDFNAIAETLLKIYEKEIGEPYPTAQPAVLKNEAYSLNNRALSVLELGRRNDALKLWRQALRVDNSHVQSVFNFNALRWSNGRITDAQFSKKLLSLESSPLTKKLRALFHIKQGNYAAARDLLENVKDNIEMREEVSLILNDLKATEERISTSPIRFGVFKTPLYPARQVLLTADKKWVLVGDEKHLHLWDTKEGQIVHTYKDPVHLKSLELINNDKSFIVADNTKVLKVFDIESGQLVNSFPALPQIALKIFKLTNGCLVSLDKSSTVTLWDAENGQIMKQQKRIPLMDKNDRLCHVAVNRDCSLVLVCYKSKDPAIFAFDSATQLEEFPTDKSTVTGCMTSDARIVALGSSRGSIYFFDRSQSVETGKHGSSSAVAAAVLRRKHLLFHLSELSEMKITPDDKTILLIERHSIRFVRLSDFQCYKALDLASAGRLTASPRQFYLSEDCTVMAVGFDMGQLAVWPTNLESTLDQYCEPRELSDLSQFLEMDMTRVTQQFNEQLTLAQSYYDEYLQSRSRTALKRSVIVCKRARQIPTMERDLRGANLWSQLSTHCTKKELVVMWKQYAVGDVDYRAESVSLSGDETKMAASYHNRIELYEWIHGTTVWKTSIKGRDVKSVVVKFSRDDQYIYAAHKHQLLILSVQDGSVIKTVEASECYHEFKSICVSNDGTLVALMRFQELFIFRTTDWQQLVHIENKNMNGHTMAFTKDDSHLYVTGKGLSVVNILSKGIKRYLEDMHFLTIYFSADYRYLYGGGNLPDGEGKSGKSAVILLDAQTHTRISANEIHYGMAIAHAMPPDCRFLLSASQDCTLQVLDMPSGTSLGMLGSPNELADLVLDRTGCHMALCVETFYVPTTEKWFIEWALEVEDVPEEVSVPFFSVDDEKSTTTAREDTPQQQQQQQQQQQATSVASNGAIDVVDGTETKMASAMPISIPLPGAVHEESMEDAPTVVAVMASRSVTQNHNNDTSSNSSNIHTKTLSLQAVAATKALAARKRKDSSTKKKKCLLM